MGEDVITMIWLAIGIVLLLSELALPGLMALFLGAAAVLVAGLRYIGLIESVSASLIAWMGLSTGLTLGLRRLVLKRLTGETRKAITEEAIQSFGEIVQVLEKVNEHDDSGRIRFQGTTWPATSTSGEIPAGQNARLVARQNLAWLVEPADSEKNGD